MKTFSLLTQNLRRARLSAGLTQQVLAERAGLDYKYYQDLESQRLSGITVATIDKIAEVLSVEVWRLFHPTEIPEPPIKKARSPRIDR